MESSLLDCFDRFVERIDFDTLSFERELTFWKRFFNWIRLIFLLLNPSKIMLKINLKIPSTINFEIHLKRLLNLIPIKLQKMK